MTLNRKMTAFQLILILGLISSLMLYGQGRVRQFLRAPDVLPGTLPEMRTPDFWIDRAGNPDQVILSLDQVDISFQVMEPRHKGRQVAENFHLFVTFCMGNVEFLSG